MSDIAIPLPSSPLYNAGTPFLLSQVQDLTSPLGGVTQRVQRVGSRFGIDVEYPSMQYPDGMAFLAAMMQAETLPVAVAFPQRGFLLTGSPGAVTVNGGGQAGTSLAVHGGAAGYTFWAGQFFDYVCSVDGRRYVHMVTATTVTGAGGAATLPIAPMIRTSPNSGDALEITAPYLEGFIQLTQKKIPWTIDMVRRIGVKFTVIEDR